MSAPAPPDTGQPAAPAGPPGRGVAVPVAVGVVVAALVAVLAVVGLVVAFDSDRLPTGPALAPPPAPVPAVSYETSLRTARFADVAVTMPASPYQCPDSTGPVSPLLSSGLVCNAPVHPKYDGSNDWSASAAFGSVPDDLSRSTPEATAQAVFQQWRASAFDRHDTTLSDYGTDQVEIDGQSVPLVHGNVNYAVKGVPSTYDRVVVIALPVQGGGYVAYISSRPDDTPKATLDVLNASLNSFR